MLDMHESPRVRGLDLAPHRDGGARMLDLDLLLTLNSRSLEKKKRRSEAQAELTARLVA